MKKREKEERANATTAQKNDFQQEASKQARQKATVHGITKALSTVVEGNATTKTENVALAREIRVLS